MKKLVMIAALAVLASGCSTVTRWEPVINTGAEKHPESVQKDVAECKVLALKAAGYLEDGAVGTLAGAAGAAATGAIAGALIPGAVSAGVGAAVGAPIGAVAGLWWSEYEADLTYRRAFSNCLWQRSHTPIN